MPLKRSIKLIVLSFLLFSAYLVFGYDNIVIHPKITGQAILLYNKNADRKIEPEQVSWIIDGAVAEDTDPRYLNHYYNSINGQGLSGWDELYGVPIKVSGMPAKEWAKNQNSATGDYSVSAILKNYREGNLKRAYQGVGHILHLIQDMAVPAHTRNDSHAMGDPYEEWAEQYGQINLNKTSFIKINNLDQAFDELAKYSNNNFYSKDTIDFTIQVDNFKNEKDINGEYFNYAYYNGYKLYKLKSYKSGDKYFLDFKAHLDYWNMLYPQAVGYSAGVIDYFVKEFEKIDEEKSKMSFWDKISIAVSKTLDTKESDKYHWGDIFLASRNAIADGWHNFTGATGQAYDFSKLVVESGGEVINNTAKKSIEAAKDAGGKVLSAIENPITAEDLFAPQKAKGGEDAGASAGQFKQEEVKVLSSEYSEDQGRLKANSISQQDAGKIGVSYVIDGDTIVLTTGEKVRYIGIDTPELGAPGPEDDECLAWAARLRNMELLGKGELKLVKDPAVDKDQYGRLLRYVYSGDIFINEQLGREGLAEEFFCKSGWQNCPITADQNRQKIIQKAVDSAEQNKRGLFSGVCEQEKAEKENNKETAMEQTNGKNSTDNSNEPSEEKKSAPNKQTTTFIPGGNSSPAAQSPYAQEEAQAGAGGEEQSNEQLENGQSEDEDSQSSSNAASSSIVLDMAAPAKIIKTAADYVVISEIYINEINSGSEWIELYNPTDFNISLSGWTIDTKSDNEADITLPTEAEILAFGYYFIGDNANGAWNPDNADWPIPDYIETITLTDQDGWVRLRNSDSDIIDLAGWGGAAVYETMPVDITNYGQGKSIERKAVATSTAETMATGGEHEWLGNSYNSDDNSQDFIVRDISDPQNSLSPVEPRENIAIIPDTINDLEVRHIFTTNNSIRLFWTSPENANLGEGARYDLRYSENSGECDLQTDWNNAIAAATSSLPIPADSAGREQTATVSGLSAGVNYCFAVRIFNGAFYSNISNVAQTKTLANQTKLTRLQYEGGWNTPATIVTQTLTPDKNPYYINFSSGMLSGQVLTIEPGVVIKFGDWYQGQWYKFPVIFPISGKIIAQGTETNPIVFTSIFDDSYCGDSNGDGAATAPEPGSWGGFQISSGDNIFNHIIVKYGGADKRGLFAFYNKEGVNQITNSVFIDNLNDSRICSVSSTNSLIVGNNFCYYNE